MPLLLYLKIDIIWWKSLPSQPLPASLQWSHCADLPGVAFLFSIGFFQKQNKAKTKQQKPKTNLLHLSSESYPFPEHTHAMLTLFCLILFCNISYLWLSDAGYKRSKEVMSCVCLLGRQHWILQGISDTPSNIQQPHPVRSSCVKCKDHLGLGAKAGTEQSLSPLDNHFFKHEHGNWWLSWETRSTSNAIFGRPIWTPTLDEETKLIGSCSSAGRSFCIYELLPGNLPCKYQKGTGPFEARAWSLMKDSALYNWQLFLTKTEGRQNEQVPWGMSPGDGIYFGRDFHSMHF